MVGRPMVSVVMPSLNQRRFIGQAIQSVLRQCYGELELIVVDGGSTDGTVELLEEVGNLDGRLRWCSRSDSGPAEALNLALKQVRGTVVGWLNSDDLYTSGAIRRAVDALEAHSSWTMVYGHAEHVDEAGNFLNRYPTQLPSGPILRFADGCFICQPTVFFKKAMHLLLGDLDQHLKASFDLDYWLRAFSAFPERIGFIDSLQAQSRLHEACITRRSRGTVAVESTRIVARHLGQAPIHWITTFVEEMMHDQSCNQSLKDQCRELLETVALVEGAVPDGDLKELQYQIQQILDPRLKVRATKVKDAR